MYKSTLCKGIQIQVEIFLSEFNQQFIFSVILIGLGYMIHRLRIFKYDWSFDGKNLIPSLMITFSIWFFTMLVILND